MKKTLALILMFSLLLVCASCGNRGPSSEEIQQEQFEAGQTAFTRITEAGEDCIDMMYAIYGAWYFAIYEADNYYSSSSCISAFASKTGLSVSDIKTAFTSLGLSTSSYYLLEDFNYSVAIAEEVLTNSGKYTEAENKLNEARETMKQMTNEYEDYTNYSTLKKYYSEVSSYLEFAKSPSGSFSQLKETIDNYETNIRTYKNDLSFIFN